MGIKLRLKASTEPFIAGLIISTLIILGAIFFIFKKPQINVDVHKAAVNPAPKEEVKKEVAEPETSGMQKKIFGYSVKQKPIEGYEIGNGQNSLLLLASIHGDEMGTTDLLNQLAEEIKINPALVATTTKLIIIPIANPDGYYDRTDKLNANGVNLNLNFETRDWKEYGPEGTYAGEKPFSEIESRVLKEVVEQYNPKAMISFHSEGAVVSPEENKASKDLAKWYGKKTGYKYYDNWDYPGTATKWFVETTGNAAITVEISKQLQSDWNINKKAFLEIISLENFGQ